MSSLLNSYAALTDQLAVLGTGVNFQERLLQRGESWTTFENTIAFGAGAVINIGLTAGSYDLINRSTLITTDSELYKTEVFIVPDFSGGTTIVTTNLLLGFISPADYEYTLNPTVSFSGVRVLEDIHYGTVGKFTVSPINLAAGSGQIGVLKNNDVLIKITNQGAAGTLDFVAVNGIARLV